MQSRFPAISPCQTRFVSLLQKLNTYAFCHPYGWLINACCAAENLLKTSADESVKKIVIAHIPP